MSKTPCEKLGYKVGDKFVVARKYELSAAEVGDILELTGDDGSGTPIFRDSSGDCRSLPLRNIVKLDGDGWIEWKGGDMPVERGTLVSIKYRDGYVTPGVSAGMFPTEKGFVCHGGCRFAHFWLHTGGPLDIVAYRLHQKEKPELEQAVTTLDDLMHAWQKAKANADTSRNILKLAEQDEAAARKALDDALRAAGWGGARQDEPLNITDWRDLKPGDIIWWSGDRFNGSGEFPVRDVVEEDDKGKCVFTVKTETAFGYAWVNIETEQWHFIRRPA